MANVFLILLVVVALSASTQAASPPPTTAPLSSANQEYLNEHNKARAEVGVGPMMWSSSLEKSVSLLVRYQRNKMSCHFAKLDGNKYGGNQLHTSSPVGPAEAVGEWVKEKVYYIHSNNTCAKGHETCGVYTQVVWRKSVELGCAQASCGKDGSLTICFYNPPGNYVGESPY